MESESDKLIGEFYKKLHNTMKTFPHWRRGQATFNVVNELRPDIANEFRGSDIDPFHDDSKIQKFLDTCFDTLDR